VVLDLSQKEDIMPIVIIEMREGRTVEQKKRLVEGIASAFENIGTPKEEVKIVINDNPAHNFAAGGKLDSEV
jgi:4-oxalocrotonate tautomerase